MGSLVLSRAGKRICLQTSYIKDCRPRGFRAHHVLTFLTKPILLHLSCEFQTKFVFFFFPSKLSRTFILNINIPLQLRGCTEHSVLGSGLLICDMVKWMPPLKELTSIIPVCFVQWGQRWHCLFGEQQRVRSCRVGDYTSDGRTGKTTNSSAPGESWYYQGKEKDEDKKEARERKRKTNANTNQFAMLWQGTMHRVK